MSMDGKSRSQTGSGSPSRDRYSTLNWLAGLMALVALISWAVATLRDHPTAKPRQAEVHSKP